MTSSKNILINVVLPLLFAILALVVILYRFNVIPEMMNKDEAEFAKLAMSLEGQPYVPYSSLATGHSTFYFYVILFAFQLFGYNQFALRIPSAVSGFFDVLLFYILVRYLFSLKDKINWFPVFVAAFVFVTSRWYINFSRFAFETTFLLFFELLSTLFVFLYTDKKKLIYLVGSGVVAGLAYNSYTPGRIFFLLPLFILLRDIPLNKIEWKKLQPAVIFLIAFGVMILPLSIYLSQHTDLRVYDQFFIMNQNLSIMTRLTYLGQNIVNNIGMLFWKGDVNGIHNYPYKPALNPVVGGLFLFGFIVSLMNWKNMYNRFFTFYFVLSIIPTIFTYPWENPNMLRTFTVLPGIAYFAGKAGEWLLMKINYRLLIIGIMTIILTGSAMYELRTYFVFQSQVFKDIFISSIDFDYYRYHRKPEL